MHCSSTSLLWTTVPSTVLRSKLECARRSFLKTLMLTTSSGYFQTKYVIFVLAFNLPSCKIVNTVLLGSRDRYHGAALQTSRNVWSSRESR
jgi:hypothetical protein